LKIGKLPNRQGMLAYLTTTKKSYRIIHRIVNIDGAHTMLVMLQYDTLHTVRKITVKYTEQTVDTDCVVVWL
jgi:hypothetical protein